MMPKARAPPTARGGIDIVVDTAVADCALGNGTGENGVPLPSPHGPPAPLANGTCAAVGIGEKAAAAALEAAMSANDISVLDGAIVEAAAAGVDKKVLVKARTRLKVLRQSEKQAAVKEAAASLQAAMKAEGACATMDLEDALEKAMRAGVAKSSLEKARRLLARRAAAEKQATARAGAEATLCDAMGEDDSEVFAAAISAAELAVGHLAQLCYSRHRPCTVCGRVGHLARVCPASDVADLEERMLEAFDVFRAIESRMSVREKEEVLSGLEALGRQLAHWRSRDALLVEMEVSARRRSGGAAAADAASSWAWHAGPRQGAARGGRRELGA